MNNTKFKMYFPLVYCFTCNRLNGVEVNFILFFWIKLRKTKWTLLLLLTLNTYCFSHSRIKVKNTAPATALYSNRRTILLVFFSFVLLALLGLILWLVYSSQLHQLSINIVLIPKIRVCKNVSELENAWIFGSIFSFTAMIIAWHYLKTYLYLKMDEILFPFSHSLLWLLLDVN